LKIEMTPVLPVDWWRPAAPRSVHSTERLADCTSATSVVAFVAALGYLIVLLLAPQQYAPILARIRIAYLLWVVAFAAYLLSRKAVPATGPRTEYGLIVALLVLSALNIPTSLWRGGALMTLTELYLKSVAFFWLLSRVVDSTRRVRVVGWTVAAASVPLAFSAVKAYLAGGGERFTLHQGMATSNANDLALVMNLFIPLIVVNGLTARRTVVRALAWGIVAACVLTVFLTFSRGGFLTLGLEAALFSAFFVRRRLGWVIVAGGLLMVVGLAAIPRTYWQRMATITSIESDPTGSSQERWKDQVAAIQLVATRPLLGAGVGQSVLALNEFRGVHWVSVHNTYLEYAVDLGLPGLFLFVWLVTAAYRGIRRVELTGPDASEFRALATGVRISLSGYVFAALFHPLAYKGPFFIVLALVVALQAIAARQSAPVQSR
jgi:hypothetical protein